MDPRWTVRTSTQLWGEQVAIMEELDYFQNPSNSAAQLAAALDRRQPVIYEFQNGAKFRAPLDPYSP
jgi:hypothetical protein